MASRTADDGPRIRLGPCNRACAELTTAGPAEGSERLAGRSADKSAGSGVSPLRLLLAPESNSVNLKVEAKYKKREIAGRKKRLAEANPFEK